MDFLNIGGLELLVLLGLAIIIMGPARAAELAGEIGRIIAKARRTINAFTEDLRTQAREETESLRDVGDTIRGLESDLRAQTREETESLREASDSLRGLESDLRQPLDAASPSPDNGASGSAETPAQDSQADDSPEAR